MSLVVFPFKSETGSVMASNLSVAAGHERVEEVWAVAAAEGEAMSAVEEMADRVSAEQHTRVKVFAQDRIGSFRPGKGDAINTALRNAGGFDRVHFYDADITNFDAGWIEGAEIRADQGFDIVRHRFPRAATDAMITWLITRPALAMLFPGTILPRLGQPLGGELLLSAAAVVRLTDDPLVTARSDWGIDTVLTYATAATGLPFFEHNVVSGKRHALYGSLAEIRTMVVECLDAVASLRGLPAPPTVYRADPITPAPEALKRIVGYDRDRSVGLLTADWSGAEVDLAKGLPGIAEEVLTNCERPHYGFMDAVIWGDVLAHLLDGFRIGDPAWESLAFRLWVMRVLAYTTAEASQGYDHAIAYLEETISGYEERSDEGDPDDRRQESEEGGDQV